MNKQSQNGGGAVKGKLRVRVEHSFQPDPEAIRRAIAAIVRLSNQRRAETGSTAEPGGEDQLEIFIQ